MKRVVCAAMCSLTVIGSARSAIAQRQEIYGGREPTHLGTTLPEFKAQVPATAGRRATFDGLIGGVLQSEVLQDGVFLPDGPPVPALFNVSAGELTVLDETPYAFVADMNDNGLTVVQGFQNDEFPSAVVLYDPATSSKEIIFTGPGLHESPRVNNLGEVAVYNNTDGVWVWPEMANLPIAEGFDPLLIELGVIEGEIGEVNLFAFSDEGWVGGRIERAGTKEQAFMWNFHTDELFRLDDPQFADVDTQVTAIGPDGLAIVEVGLSRTEEVYRWDGTTLEPLDPRSALFLSSFPMIDVNSSGQAVGGRLARINDFGQIASLGGSRVFDPECQCDRDVVTLSRLDPLHIEGDYDASGKVDQGDLDLVLLHWGGEVLPDDWYHDFPDLPIDQAELDTVLLRWGRTDGTPVLPVQGSVPEARTFTLILIGLVTTGIASVIRRRICPKTAFPWTSDKTLIANSH